MATGRIRGITIELSADTKGLYKGLTEARTAANNVQKALKDVNNLLKMNPTSTELLTQKQKLLAERVTEVGNRLEEEKRLLQELQNSADSDKTVQQQEALKRQIEATEQELKRATEELRNFGSVGAQQIAAVGEKMKEVGDQMAEFGKNWTQKVSVPVAAALTAAGKGALDFEDAMAKVHTLTDDTVTDFEKLSEGVMALSDETGKSGTELAEAMYQALSASVDAADALEFTEKAAKLARAGFLDTAGAVDVLTTILNAYQKEASETDKISDLLIQTQNDGKTTVNELAQQMGQVIPTAAAYNISLENLTTAYALMTKNGINTANSTTYLNGMFTELARQGSEVSKILNEKTGKTFGQLMEEGKSLGDVLQILYDSVGGNAEEFANLWGNVRAGRGALTLAQQGAEGFNDELDRMNKATGNVDKALKKLDTPSLQIKKSLNQLKNTGIQLGQTLLEILQPAFDKLTEAAQGISKWWKELSPETQELIVKAGLLAAAIGPIIVVLGKVTSGIGSILTSIPKIQGAVTGLFGVLAAHPFVALGVAAAAAFAAIVTHISKTADAYGPATEAAKKFKEANEETLASVEANGVRMDTLRQRIEELNAVEELSNVQKEMMAQYVAELNELLGEEAIHIDDATGKTQENTQEIYKNIEAMKQQALAAAYSEMIAAAAKEAAMNQIALADAQTALAINSQQLEEAQRNLEEAERSAAEEYANASEEIRNQIDLQSYIYANTNAESKAVADLKAEREELSSAVRDNTNAYTLNMQEMQRLDNASKRSIGLLDDLLKTTGKTASDLSPTLQAALNEGIYALPATVEELNRLIKFDEAVNNAGEQGAALVSDLQGAMLRGEITVEQATARLIAAADVSGAKESADKTGRSIAQGLAGGMDAESWRVTNAAQRLANSANSAIRKAAMVNSPSRFTMWIGAMIDAGLGKGIEDNISKYIDPAVSEINDSLAFDGAINAAYSQDEVAGRMQTQQPTLDPAAIYQAVKSGAEAAVLKGYISPAEVTRAVNTQNTTWQAQNLSFKGAY